MFKKTKIRSILELLDGEQNFSEREIAEMLSVSRNTVKSIRESFKASGLTMDAVKDWDDDRLYQKLCPEKFQKEPLYAPVDYSYVHNELGKTEVTEYLLWEEYCKKCDEDGARSCSYVTFTKNYKDFTADRNYTSRIEHKPGREVEVDWSGPTMSYTDSDTGVEKTAYLFVATLPYSQLCYVEATEDMKENAWLTCHVNMFQFFGGVPVKIVCDNLKTGVTSHPKKGEIVLNDAYLALGEYYSIAISPTGVKKPKQKASVEGSVGKIATAIIARLRNETFHSIAGLNARIKKELKAYNEKPFQKREGSRQTVFEVEELPFLRPLPLIPYEVCEWSYGHKVSKNSHIWWDCCQYSVPSSFIGKKVDVKYNHSHLLVYYNRTEIAKHLIFPHEVKNGIRTDESHLPFALKHNLTLEDIRNRAREIGPSVFELIRRMLDESKVPEQASINAKKILILADNYSDSKLEAACLLAMTKHHTPSYSVLSALLKDEDKVVSEMSGKKPANGMVRGADYYKTIGNGGNNE